MHAGEAARAAGRRDGDANTSRHFIDRGALPRGRGRVHAVRARTAAQPTAHRREAPRARPRTTANGGAGSRAVRVIVVESPAKAKTLAKYLGTGHRVIATRGHVSDLPAKAGSVRPDEDFATTWETARGAARRLAAIAKALESADALVLATDPDREGEAIAWQVLEWLSERGALAGRAVYRAALGELTEGAVGEALARRRGLDMHLVRAWQARRALDYLVGYGLSPLLWRKLPGCRSAGRVQSVALRLLCEREAQIEAFSPRTFWTVEAVLAGPDGARFRAALRRLDGAAVGEAGFATARAAKDAAARLRRSVFTVSSTARDVVRRAPRAPLTTATLQHAAWRRLGLGVGETMAIARRLYDGVDLRGERCGLITYMRTDSTVMAKPALARARAAIGERHGADYLPARARSFRPRPDGGAPPRAVQEGHEAIRPTNFSRTPDDLDGHLDRAAVALYALIRDRALASQAADARFERLRAELVADDGAIVLEARCSVLAFDGHLRILRGGDAGREADAADASLPSLAEGDRVAVVSAEALRHVTQPPARYAEAGLVRRLDALGIGRPSTWTGVLAVLRERGYAVVREGHLAPSESGRVVTAFLEDAFGRWVDYGFTAAMEGDLDRIAAGALAWRGMLEGFWASFRQALDGAGALTRGAVREAVEERLAGLLFGERDRRCPACRAGRLELRLSRYGPFVGCAHYPGCGYRRGLAAAGEDAGAGPRELGADPDTGEALSLRRGPTGWYVQRSAGDGAKPARMSLPPALAPGAVDRDLARRLLALPREVGRHPDSGEPVLAGIGRYGPWLRHGETYAPIPAGEDVLTVGLNRAVALLAEKEIRASRAREPSQVLRRLGRHPGDGAPVWLLCLARHRSHYLDCSTMSCSGFRSRLFRQLIAMMAT